MRGASAGSLERLTDQLGTAIESGSDAARTAEDLFAVSALLRREPSLRRMTTDLSLQPAAKSDFVRGLLAEQLDPASMDVVAGAVTQRWAATRDLADALEELGVIAVVKGADRAGQADALEDELFGFGRLVSENPELRDALSDPARSAEDKHALLDGLLDGRVTAATAALAKQAVVSSHRTVTVAVEHYQKVAANNRNRLVATVRVARELSDADRQRLQGVLARQYDKPVHLNVVVDPEVVGGVKVDIGDDVIDGTVANRLDDARRRLAG
jgi:F-type H+-transporting ATPase subunit delta